MKICNSVRVYEFYGYDWWIPLWDKEFMYFWEKVPLRLRKGREWYLEYVKQVFAESSVIVIESELNNASDDGNIKTIVKNSFFYKRNFFRFITRKICGFFMPAKSSLAYESWFSADFYSKHKNDGYCINGMLAKVFLNKE